MTLPAARDLSVARHPRDDDRARHFDTPMLAALPEEHRAGAGRGRSRSPRGSAGPTEYGALVTEIVANTMLNGETIRLDGALRMPPK